MNHFAPKYIAFIFFCLSISAFSQIKLSHHIQDSKLSKSNNNALFFVDFWATWCNPCIHVSKYLETLQKQFPENFYVLSLTQETPEVVTKFLLKHDINLAIAIDYDGETFKKHNIYSLPHGILFNANGEKLWEGHPANFKKQHLESFLKKHTKLASKSSFFKIEAYVETSNNQNENNTKDFDYSILENFTPFSAVQILENDDFIALSGSLQQILGYVLKVNTKQIVVNNLDNINYLMRFNKYSHAFINMKHTIFDALNLSETINDDSGEILSVSLNQTNFWDNNQINWEGNNQKFLIGDSELQADNVSFNELLYKISNLIDIPVILSQNYVDASLHDWQIHYKYFEFMVSNFEDYGVKILKKKGSYPVYKITKKAP
ncbi:hypothetical protein PK35_02130 [Tamlana nanhaiensis]|uniref:Thioredoxin domain-containing protein n=1 Tax=Neotamlana nanhaiensis TaxID=1382798 RepID=A0A0D7W629_9FLAO|nr:TlpA disulfide reductase family protein [Tamlana nanhaiensis]KJD34601.1 hypothetical protein PK35_02130 [Tamlana nanhaiensis]